MPTEELAFENFSENAAQDFLGLVVIVELRDKVDSLLALHVRDETRIIDLRRPIQKRLSWTHDKNGSIQHDWYPKRWCDPSMVRPAR